ncbi:asparagine synthase-related protein [Sphingomonas sp. MMS12-HWE2-04]|uniref:asparagine synthase-related protein n=1 Tax=Sphingomonas sp. MMS12-HWE2-04 TaxID=3234199 RepID=UPI00384B9775
MALRYLIAFDRQSGAYYQGWRGRLSSIGLEPVVATESVRIWCNAPAEVVATASGRTVVLGQLFTREDRPSRVIDLDPSIDRVPDPPLHLSRHYWGRYVAVSRAAVGSVQIFRDPGGGLPCYVRETADHVLVFSDLGVLNASGRPSPEIDWGGVRDALVWPALRTSRTALRDIYEVPQGWLLGLGGKHFSELRKVWSPWEHVAPTGLAGGELAEALHSTVVGTVQALARGADAVQLSLSGGLNSSIVAAALTGTPTTGFNMVADGSHGDERADARLVTDHLGLELVDRRYRLEDVDLARSSAAHLPRPVGNAARLAFDKACLEFAKERGIPMLFSGFGGDNVFCYMRSVSPVVDLVRSRGSPAQYGVRSRISAG